MLTKFGTWDANYCFKFSSCDVPERTSSRTASQEIAQNYVFLRPLCEVFSDHVPGAVLLTDVWLMLDQLFGGKLLCKPGESKRTQAATEAGRCKKLMGALRYLFRNSSFDCATTCLQRLFPTKFYSMFVFCNLQFIDIGLAIKKVLRATTTRLQS